MDFFVFLGFLSKLLLLLIKVNKVTTGHQKLPKMGQNSIITSFLLPESPPQELEVGSRSGPYLLVILIKYFPYIDTKNSNMCRLVYKSPSSRQNKIITQYLTRRDIFTELAMTVGYFTLLEALLPDGMETCCHIFGN